jgi:hypothetical protein
MATVIVNPHILNLLQTKTSPEERKILRAFCRRMTIPDAKISTRNRRAAKDQSPLIPFAQGNKHVW